MATELNPETILARSGLLDALQALGTHRESVDLLARKPSTFERARRLSPLQSSRLMRISLLILAVSSQHRFWKRC